MSQKPQPSITEKIENAVEGLLKFLLRFLRTTWLIFSRPFSSTERLLNSKTSAKTFVLPFTYLAIGGFIYTLVFSAYPRGILHMLDLVWFDQEVETTIYERWREVLTINGILVATFPILIAVPSAAVVLKRLVFPDVDRSTFLKINNYLLGYHALLFFSFFYFIILENLLGTLLSVNLLDENAIFLRIILSVMLAASMLTAMFTPLVSMAH